MTWGPGRDEVSTLVAGGELERVAPDTALAARLLDDGTRHVESARSAERLGDLTGAYQLAYDALRKACLLYTSPSPRDRTRSRMPSSA